MAFILWIGSQNWIALVNVLLKHLPAQEIFFKILNQTLVQMQKTRTTSIIHSLIVSEEVDELPSNLLTDPLVSVHSPQLPIDRAFDSLFLCSQPMKNGRKRRIRKLWKFDQFLRCFFVIPSFSSKSLFQLLLQHFHLIQWNMFSAAEPCMYA